MSGRSGPRSGVLHAALREVEPGLYAAEYGGEINPQDSDSREVPDRHVDTDPEGVKSWVEQMALGLGYDRVVWDEDLRR